MTNNNYNYNNYYDHLHFGCDAVQVFFLTLPERIILVELDKNVCFVNLTQSVLFGNIYNVCYLSFSTGERVSRSTLQTHGKSLDQLSLTITRYFCVFHSCY